MKKSTIIGIVLAIILLLGSSGVYAAGQIARSNAITEDEAINFACVDAGVSPEEITVTKVEFDFEHGKFVYEIEFTAGETEYEYVIDSSTGQVLDKETESKNAYVGDKDKKDDSGKSGNPSGSSTVIESDVIGIEKAKEIALNSAGLKADDVVFNKAKLDREDGKIVYDIEFYVYGKAEYDYEIDAKDGTILEEGFESWEADDIPAPGLSQNSSSSSPAESQKTPEPEPTPAPAPAESQKTPESEPTPAPAPVAPSTISSDSAKSIALSRAGVSAGSAVFEKVKLEEDDGSMVYDVEFYVPSQGEYEVEIDAYSGAVIDYDYDPFDEDDD